MHRRAKALHNIFRLPKIAPSTFAPNPMTILDNLITLAQITGSIDVQCSFNGDWYVRHNHNRTQGVVHIVTHGTGYLKLDNEAQARQLQAGDIIFFPRNAAHTLST